MTIKRLFKAALREVVWIGIHFFPVKKNRILVSSYYGRGYGDNPKYIVEELLKGEEYYEIIWTIKHPDDIKTLPHGVKACKKGTLKEYFYIATSKIWIDNCRKYFKYKKKTQYYLQTWHGFALKRIEKDVENNLSKHYVKMSKHDAAHTDLIVSDSDFMTSVYQNSFWYTGRVVQWGAPRNDIILSPLDQTILKQAVQAKYNIDSETNIILYAPTFRANHSLKPYAVDFERLIRACNERFGVKHHVLLRLHPNIAEMSSQLNINPESVSDASNYPDMQELLSASDIVISDYSSLMFDFALSEKPVFQFATDIEDYKDDRNFYFDLNTLPFLLATNNNQLIRNIQTFDEKEYKIELNTFFESVGMVRRGNAAEKCADHIAQIIKS